MLGLGLSALVNNDRGTVRVICNVPQARVILDAVVTDYYTDTVIPGIPSGRHFLTLEKTGYKIEGDIIQEIAVKSRDTIVLSFYLVPIGGDSVRSEKPIAVDAPVRIR